MTIPQSSPDANHNKTLIVMDSVAKVPLGLTGSSLTNANPLHVAIVDGVGTQITSFGGGTQYANDSAQATPTGTVALGWDGTNVRALSTDTSGKLNITGSITASNPSVSSTGASAPASATFIGGVYNSSVPTITSGNLTALQTDVNGNLKVTLATLFAGEDTTNNLLMVGGNVASGSVDAGNPVKVGGIYNSSSPTFSSGQRGDLQLDSSGNLKVSLPSLPAGTNTIGGVTLPPQTSGGVTTSSASSAASTNATSVKASAGQVYGWAVFNNTSSNRYVKVYNKASAPTVGTDTPFLRILVPPNGGANVWFGNGIPLATGIAYAITAGASDTDTTAISANDVFMNLFYA